MDLARHDFFARAALAGDQHAHVGVGDLIDHEAHPREARRIPQRGRFRTRALRLRLLVTELGRSCERALDGGAQLALVDRLRHEVARARLHRVHDRARTAARREHHDRHVGIERAHAPQQIDAAVPRAEPEIEQHEVVGPSGTHHGDRAVGILCGVGAQVVRREYVGNARASRGGIVGDERAAQCAFRAHAGAPAATRLGICEGTPGG